MDTSPEVLNEFFVFMTGKKLGEGMSRKVYDHPTDPTLVIKVEDSTCHFQNVIEWETWNQFQYAKDVKKWLAPCVSISYNGTFLIQKKAIDLRPEEIPDKMPAWITDHKIKNFGLYEGRVVCRDYGLLTLNPNNRLRKWNGSREAS